MKAWKKGAVIGLIIGFVFPFITMTIFPLGILRVSVVSFIAGSIFVGGILGAVIAFSIGYYKKHETKVSLKYPIGGFVLFYSIQYFYLVVGLYILREEFFSVAVFRAIIWTPFYLIFNPQPMIINLFGLIFGYLIGYIVSSKRKNTSKMEEK